MKVQHEAQIDDVIKFQFILGREKKLTELLNHAHCKQSQQSKHEDKNVLHCDLDFDEYTNVFNNFVNNG